MRNATSVIGLIGLLLVPIVAFAATSDDSYRDCMRNITSNREQRIVDVTGNYHHNWQNIIADRKIRVENAWNVANDNDRRSILRQVDKEITALLRENEKNYKNDIKIITTDARNDEKRCNDELRSRDQARRRVPVGRQCFGTDTCSAPEGICTVEYGDCRQVCTSGNCRCAGICVIR
jgi:hypothetical protein